MKKIGLFLADQLISSFLAFGLYLAISPVFDILFKSLLESHLVHPGGNQALEMSTILQAASKVEEYKIVIAVQCVIIASVFYFIFLRNWVRRRLFGSILIPKLLSCGSFLVLPAISIFTGYLLFGGGNACAPTELTYIIPAQTMANGASDNSGTGSCRGVVHFNRSGGSTKMGKEGIASCGSYHCGTLKYGDGREKANHCTVFAQCKGGKAVATGFTW